MKREVIKITVLMVTMLFVTGCSQTKLNVKEDHMTVEYGNVVSLDAKDYLDNDADFLSNVEVFSDIGNEDKAGYTPVGKYTLSFVYKNQEAKVQVSVVDTVKPEFANFKNTVEVYQNSKVDFDALYTAEDLSEVVITYDDSKVDYSVGGNYTATVTATDSSGNAEIKEVTVNVIPVTVQLDKSTSTVYAGETVRLNVSVNIPEGKATFTSSDSYIATVDENGLVKGVKSGEVTITAELNGIKSECKVVVSNKTAKVTSSSNTNSASNMSGNKGDASGSTNSGSSNHSTTNSGSYNDVAVETATTKTSKEAFDLINKERVALGLEPAVWDAECERIALIRVQELAELGTITADNGHDGFWKFQAENRKLGECIACGYHSALGAVTGWMDSSAHKEILMMENRVKLAIAYCDDKWVAINSK